MLVAGTVGLSAIVFMQLVYFIGSIYTIFFGFLVLTVEMRDKVQSYTSYTNGWERDGGRFGMWNVGVRVHACICMSEV